ncbi:MAG: 16S rRNA (uracil(1498)-N(3))-methyltransferase [Desulfobacteraceae bacterium]|jgi:16S rRNA (uracil1498-N3)-methyltransferase
MRRFYIDKNQVNRNEALLTGQDAKHLRDALRLQSGDKVCLFDGTGHEYLSEITSISQDSVQLNILDHTYESESPVRITLAQAFLKDKKMDTLVRQVSELGISQWLPYQAARSVAKPDNERLKARKERWIKIVKESLKQCGRSRLPEICDTVSFKDALSMVSHCDLKILFWEKSGTPLSELSADVQAINKNCSSVCIFLGPEGGFEDKEVEMAKQNGFVTLSLGPRILKADTASLAACALVQHLFGDME